MSTTTQVRTGREILPSGPPRSQWLNVRRTGIGGSDALTLAGLNPNSSRYELWLDKTGQALATAETPAMKRGRILEPSVRAWFIEDTRVHAEPAGTWQSTHNPIMLANPDGFASDDGGLELKTAGPFVANAELWKNGQIPDGAEVQAQWCMHVTGRDHWWIAALVLGVDTLIVHRIAYDPLLCAGLERLAVQFWEDHVIPGVPPTIDGSQATTDALTTTRPKPTGETLIADHLAPLRAEADQIKATIAPLSARLDVIGNVFRSELGAHRYAKTSDGETLAEWRTTTPRRISATLVRERHPEVAAECTTTSTVHSLYL